MIPFSNDHKRIGPLQSCDQTKFQHKGLVLDLAELWFRFGHGIELTHIYEYQR